MVEPPPGTAVVLLRADPLRLEELNERGIALYNTAKTEEERIEGARLVHVAAVLGYGPARGVLARSFPRSHAVRSVTTRDDAVRFALDAFAMLSAFSNDPRQVVRNLAAFYIEQAQAGLFARSLLDALRDDARLQQPERLDALFETLAEVRLGCNALSTLVDLRDPPEPACKAEVLRRATRRYLETAGPIGRDASGEGECVGSQELTVPAVSSPGQNDMAAMRMLNASRARLNSSSSSA
jgi:hypothetical protein